MPAAYRIMHSGIALLLTLGALLPWQPLLAQDAADGPYSLSEADWPCHGRYRETFSAGAFWQGPSLDGAAEALAGAPATRKLAETIAGLDVGRNEASTMIGDFAAALPDDGGRGRSLALLFAATLDEVNLYRRFMLEGIVANIARQRIARDAMAQSEVALQELAGDTSAEAETRRKTLEHRRFWEGRAFEDAEEDAQFLCHRLTALEGKLGRLARAIAAHL